MRMNGTSIFNKIDGVFLGEKLSSFLCLDIHFENKKNTIKDMSG